MSTSDVLPRMEAAPRLLVSVRNAEEAAAALAGGSQIIDVKEPHRGSLGMAALSQIAAVVAEVGGRVPVSAALGEVTDWINLDDVPVLPAGLSFAKLGMAGLGCSRDSLKRWNDVRQAFAQRAEVSWNWVAVAYIDWQWADGPNPETVIEAAAVTDCRVVLFDTCTKNGRTLLDSTTSEELSRRIERIHDLGMWAALAGGITDRDLPLLLTLNADIIGIRGAACAGGTRTDGICATALHRFRTELSSSMDMFSNVDPAALSPSPLAGEGSRVRGLQPNDARAVDSLRLRG